MNVLLPVLLAATIPLRNPFWPIGHSGVREVITDEPRVEIKAASADEEKRDVETSVNAETIAAARAQAEAEAAQGDSTDRLWIAARKSLKIGGIVKSGERQSVSINGSIYADGDVVATNFDGNRFFWRVRGLTESGILRLQRLRYKELETESDEKGPSL